MEGDSHASVWQPFNSLKQAFPLPTHVQLVISIVYAPCTPPTCNVGNGHKGPRFDVENYLWLRSDVLNRTSSYIWLLTISNVSIEWWIFTLYVYGLFDGITSYDVKALFTSLSVKPAKSIIKNGVRTGGRISHKNNHTHSTNHHTCGVLPQKTHISSSKVSIMTMSG